MLTTDISYGELKYGAKQRTKMKILAVSFQQTTVRRVTDITKEHITKEHALAPVSDRTHVSIKQTCQKSGHTGFTHVTLSTILQHCILINALWEMSTETDALSNSLQPAITFY